MRGRVQWLKLEGFERVAWERCSGGGDRCRNFAIRGSCTSTSYERQGERKVEKTRVEGRNRSRQPFFKKKRGRVHGRVRWSASASASAHCICRRRTRQTRRILRERRRAVKEITRRVPHVSVEGRANERHLSALRRKQEQDLSLSLLRVLEARESCRTVGARGEWKSVALGEFSRSSPLEDDVVARLVNQAVVRSAPSCAVVAGASIAGRHSSRSFAATFRVCR